MKRGKIKKSNLQEVTVEAERVRFSVEMERGRHLEGGERKIGTES